MGEPREQDKIIHTETIVQSKNTELGEIKKVYRNGDVTGIKRKYRTATVNNVLES